MQNPKSQLDSFNQLNWMLKAMVGPQLKYLPRYKNQHSLIMKITQFHT